MVGSDIGNVDVIFSNSTRSATRTTTTSVRELTVVHISALVQAKISIRHLSRQSGDLCILPRGVSWIGLVASQKVKVEYATDDVILQRGHLFVIAELDVHPIRAEQRHGVRAALKVLGMDAI